MNSTLTSASRWQKILVGSFAIIALGALSLASFTLFVPAASANHDSVKLCHTTGSGWNALTVDDDAVSGHLGHGDFLYSGNDTFNDAWCAGHVPAPATVVATKIVCPSESDLPNRSGGANITSTTASDFIAAHPQCSVVPWTFQWRTGVNASDNTNPGDNTGAAGTPWASFASGVSGVSVPASAFVWIREVMDSAYIPFTGVSGSNVSAEMYCNTDVLHYDNYDFVSSMSAGQSYYCVAWNVAKKGTLQIVKSVVGSDESPSAFSFSIDEALATNFNGNGDNSVTVNTGSHSVTETPESGYVTTYSNSQNQNADCNNLTVSEDSTTTCTITNTKKGSITITKETNVEQDETSFAFTGDVSGNLSNGQSATEEVSVGTYSSTEGDLGAGWALTSISCSDSQQEVGGSTVDLENHIAHFNVQPGEHVTCVFTNTYTPPQCVVPQTDNTADPQVAIGVSDETTLQQMLTNASIGVDAATQQKTITSWTGDGTQTANFTATFLDRMAGAVTSFGYWANGDNTTFHSLFTAPGNSPASPSSASFSISNFASVIFGIQTTFGGSNTYTTDPTNVNNTDGTNQHALVYHPTTDTYAMGFEDLPLPSDHDYNDMTVKVTADSCVPTPTMATVKFTKIVCDNPADMPHYGPNPGGPDITSSTATNWIGEAHPSCHLAKDWQFEWAPSGTPDLGDGDTHVGAAGGTWTTSGLTASDGTVTVQVPPTDSETLTWFREVLKDAYIPFTFHAHSDNSGTPSAEMYCGTDVLNYDNYDWLQGVQAGHNYYCVAWNSPVNEESQNADLGVVKHVDNATPHAGDTVHYTITVHNYGPSDATGVVVHDELPVGVSYVSDDSSDDYSTVTHDWTVGSLANGADATLVITVTVGSLENGTVVDNTATVTEGDTVVSEGEHSDADTSSFTVTVSDGCTENCGASIDSDACPNLDGFQPAGTNCQTGGNDNNNSHPGGGGGIIQSSGGGGGIITQPGLVLGASCGLYMDKHIKFGSKKNDVEQVKKLQTFLNKWMNAGLPVTGFYGPLTLAAVNAFQAKYVDEILKPWGLNAPTGLVYLSTLREINLLECPDLAIQLPNLVPWSSNPNAQ